MINKLIELLGEENESRLKSEIVDLILDAVKTDLSEFVREEYLIRPDDMNDFLLKCQEEAFRNVKQELITKMEENIRANMKMENMKSNGRGKWIG